MTIDWFDFSNAVKISQERREEWIAEWIDKVPKYDYRLVHCGDSMVLLTHTDEGIDIYDMVVRRHGSVETSAQEVVASKWPCGHGRDPDTTGCCVCPIFFGAPK